MVLAAGLTSRREPASFSRHLVELGIDGAYDLVVPNMYAAHERLTNDPNDDYLAHAALQADAYLVTRDDAAGFEHVDGLRLGRPGSALRLLGALGEALGE